MFQNVQRKLRIPSNTRKNGLAAAKPRMLRLEEALLRPRVLLHQLPEVADLLHHVGPLEAAREEPLTGSRWFLLPMGVQCSDISKILTWPPNSSRTHAFATKISGIDAENR